MGAFDDLKTILKGELNAADLGSLRSAFDNFVSGTPEERAAAEAIANHVKEAAQAFMDGTISRHSLEFILDQARSTSLMLAENKAIRLKKSIIKAFFNVVITILVKKL